MHRMRSRTGRTAPSIETRDVPSAVADHIRQTTTTSAVQHLLQRRTASEGRRRRGPVEAGGTREREPVDEPEEPAASEWGLATASHGTDDDGLEDEDGAETIPGWRTSQGDRARRGTNQGTDTGWPPEASQFGLATLATPWLLRKALHGRGRQRPLRCAIAGGGRTRRFRVKRLLDTVHVSNLWHATRRRVPRHGDWTNVARAYACATLHTSARA